MQNLSGLLVLICHLVKLVDYVHVEISLLAELFCHSLEDTHALLTFLNYKFVEVFYLVRWLVL